ncbi:MAG: hypothetical protein ACRD1R_16865 [Acidobacteriota bacterium]
MKAVQITFDEELLHELESQYKKAYAANHGLEEEFAGWEGQGEWPEK